MRIPNASLSPRARLQVATLLVLGLALLGPLGGVSVVSTARWLLVLAALSGLGWWWFRRGASGARVASVERMQVISRAGLSPRCGLALVEVEGRGFLVAFGDAFAEVHALPEREAEPGILAQARRPRPGRGLRKGMQS
ncbi:flagellar biosynthetic protein FliO [Myxococcus qinghaiensis]|uniref:flagellar biosynthetic protein FliO n=1 Tax=Myxococcus qinghaiensis TaxID=2906758 RepID=UPI0020A7843C|nr:flagellar biosynthetic protein FliO [Myxococcus qinghaiensis]MCP3162656.1 flagellar biosynthetic protein FliO [Myxococcus qinghaiensis]